MKEARDTVMDRILSLTGQSDREVRDEPRSTHFASKHVLKTAAGGEICKKPCVYIFHQDTNFFVQFESMFAAHANLLDWGYFVQYHTGIAALKFVAVPILIVCLLCSLNPHC